MDMPRSLLVLVRSACADEARREAVRQTWGSDPTAHVVFVVDCCSPEHEGNGARLSTDVFFCVAEVARAAMWPIAPRYMYMSSCGAALLLALAPYWGSANGRWEKHLGLDHS